MSRTRDDVLSDITRTRREMSSWEELVLPTMLDRLPSYRVLRADLADLQDELRTITRAESTRRVRLALLRSGF